LLQTSEFHDLVGCILFAANDSMGAASGERWMAEHGLRVTALSGVLTSSPLSTREAAKATGLPIYSRQDLARPRTAMAILAAARRAGGNENGGAYMRWSTAQAAPVVAVPTMLESGAAE
jgi:hypothetical protein